MLWVNESVQKVQAVKKQLTKWAIKRYFLPFLSSQFDGGKQMAFQQLSRGLQQLTPSGLSSENVVQKAQQKRRKITGQRETL